MAVKLSIHAVTGRACARPAPVRLAAYGRRWADAAEAFMRTTMMSLLIVLGADGQATAQEMPSCKPVTATCLASFSMEPSGPEMEVADAAYLELVARGLEVVPELAELLADDTQTPQRVPLVGGNWSVGDIAMSALSDIIRDVPWLTFASKEFQEHYDDCGFCVYWDYVRTSPRNRRSLRKSFRTWYSQHAPHLVWEVQPDSLTLGRYVDPKHAW